MHARTHARTCPFACTRAPPTCMHTHPRPPTRACTQALIALWVRYSGWSKHSTFPREALEVVQVTDNVGHTIITMLAVLKFSVSQRKCRCHVTTKMSLSCHNENVVVMSQRKCRRHVTTKMSLSCHNENVVVMSQRKRRRHVTTKMSSSCHNKNVVVMSQLICLCHAVAKAFGYCAELPSSAMCAHRLACVHVHVCMCVHAHVQACASLHLHVCVVWDEYRIVCGMG